MQPMRVDDVLDARVAFSSRDFYLQPLRTWGAVRLNWFCGYFSDCERHSEYLREIVLFEMRNDFRQELSPQSAIDDAVVKCEGQVNHRADRY